MEVTKDMKAQLDAAFAMRGKRVRADFEGELRRPRLRDDGVVTVDVKGDSGKLQTVAFKDVKAISERGASGTAAHAAKADKGDKPDETRGED